MSAAAPVGTRRAGHAPGTHENQCDIRVLSGAWVAAVVAGLRLDGLIGSHGDSAGSASVQPLPLDLTAARVARTAVRRAAAGRESLAETLSLICSELVANALRHGFGLPAGGGPGGGPLELALISTPAEVVCAVRDPSPVAPRRAEADRLAGSGRGLQMVACLSAVWGWTPLESGGKAVWAVLPLPVPEAAAG